MWSAAIQVTHFCRDIYLPHIQSLWALWLHILRTNKMEYTRALKRGNSDETWWQCQARKKREVSSTDQPSVVQTALQLVQAVWWTARFMGCLGTLWPLTPWNSLIVLGNVEQQPSPSCQRNLNKIANKSKA